MAFWSRLRSAVPPRRAVAAASVAAGALTTYSLPNTVFADAMDTSETSVAIHNSNMGKNVLGDKLLRGKTIAEASEELNRARKRVAIFGGSFNPITNAHLNCAAEIIHSKLADEVWITPCGSRPDKPSLKTPGLHRLIMCHLAVDTTFGSRFGVKVCDEEMKEPRNIPTIILMRRLKAKNPNYDFSFVVGSDLIPTLHEWEAPGCEGRWEAIPDAGQRFLEENHFLVIDRPGEDDDLAKDGLTPNFELIAPALEARGSRLTETLLSSSEVRHRMRGADDIVRFGLRKGANPDGKAGQPAPISETRSWYDEVEGLVPPSVLGHIVRYGLYAREDGVQSD